MILRQVATWMMLKQFPRPTKEMVLFRNHVPSRDSSYYYHLISRKGVQSNICTQNGRRPLLLWREGVSYNDQMQLLALCILHKLDSIMKKVNIGNNSAVLVICGPSGSGKSTIIQRLFKDYPNKFGFSVSHTTRKARPGEVDGVHYYFTTLDEMNAAIERGEFLETAKFSGNTYGTSYDSIRRVCDQNKVCVLDIEMEGVKQVKQTDLNPILIFIKPPSMAELQRRLKARGTENEDLKRRITRARIEMDYGEIEGNFHKTIVNDDINDAYKRFHEFVKTELERRKVELDDALKEDVI